MTAVERCDVLVVGGGPAGSTCATALVRAGLDVIVADKARFPRDKVCAGWITPAVVEELALDLDDYGRGRTIEAVRGFRIGRMGDRAHVHRYEHPMSYGIRRCEFDHYLLERSGARQALDVRVSTIVQRGERWLVNDRFEADVLVGAGGHFCPVAKRLGAEPDAAVIAAEEVEFAVADDDVGAGTLEPGVPELYFTRDFTGYGWAFRKGAFVNIGLGVLGDSRRGADGAEGPALRRRVEDFLGWLIDERRIKRAPAARMVGHAYLTCRDSRRRRFGDGFVLVGDAAGLAFERSGEGIRCAVESGMLAAQTIRDALARGSTRASALCGYGEALQQRFGAAGHAGLDPAALLPAAMRRAVAAALMASGWFSRHVVLERWFLHADEEPLAPAFTAAGAFVPSGDAIGGEW